MYGYITMEAFEFLYPAAPPTTDTTNTKPKKCVNESAWFKLQSNL